MTRRIAFTAFIDSDVVADECIANPAILAEILHCVAKSSDNEVTRMVTETSEEVRDVYDAIEIGWFLRALADRIEAPNLPSKAADEDLVTVRTAVPAEKGIPIPPETNEEADMDTRYVLKKISKQGRVYFFTGTLALTFNAEGKNVLQADTGQFEGDAHRFETFDGADEWANLLNMHGIGGADWQAMPVERDD